MSELLKKQKQEELINDQEGLHIAGRLIIMITTLIALSIVFILLWVF